MVEEGFDKGNAIGGFEIQSYRGSVTFYRIRSWRRKIRGTGLSMGSINAENGGAIVGEEKAGGWALGALLEW